MKDTEIPWRQGNVVTLLITDLDDQGNGVGRVADRVVFVPGTVPGDRIQVTLTHVKPQYGHGKLKTILAPSLDRHQPACIVADKCGGCQWQHITYDRQLAAKQNQVVQALQRIGSIPNPPVDPILASPSPLRYRNKATYPLGERTPLPLPSDSPSQPQDYMTQVQTSPKLRTPQLSLRVPRPVPRPIPRPTRRTPAAPLPLLHSPRRMTHSVIAGYYQKGSHVLINLNQCPVQDDRLNPLLAEVKQDIQRQGWTIYNEVQHQGQLRHLSLRIGRRTGEILLTLVTTTRNLPRIAEQAEEWMQRYPGLVGICINHNPQRTNAIFGTTTACVAGRGYLHEQFAGLTLRIQPTTFFQVHTEQAEALLHTISTHLDLQGDETLVDAYCGIGTFTLPLAQRVRWAIGLEAQAEAVAQAAANAELNDITNVMFHAGNVEALLPELGLVPDLVLLDPPRKGCDRAVLEWLLAQQPARVVYISCKPATLARDLQHLCGAGTYTLERVQPADFFPQTTHVECAAFLRRSVSR